MGQWYNSTVPKCKEKKHSDECLVTVETAQSKRVVKAVYIPYHHCTVEDMGWNMPDGVPDEWDYFEKEDTWWIPEGWYETCDYFEEYCYASITDNVIAWSKLPKPYEPRVRKMQKLSNTKLHAEKR